MSHPTKSHNAFLSCAIRHCVAIGLLATCVVACSASTSAWKEEVLLHDGRKMVIERSNTYRGRSEPGQSGPLGEHRMTFALPGSSQRITWVSEYSDNLGRMNFLPLALHVLGERPYVVAYPNLCLSYQKWGRPNPPYVIFEYKGDTWTRIPLTELPEQFTTINLTLSIQKFQADEMSREGVVTAERVKELNRGIQQAYLRTILHAPLSKADIQELCPTYPSGPKAPS